METFFLGLIHKTRSRTLRAIFWIGLAVIVVLGTLECIVFTASLFNPKSEARTVIASWLSWLPHGPWVWPAIFIVFILCFGGLFALELLRAAVTRGLIRDPATEAQIEQSAPQRPNTLAAIPVPRVRPSQGSNAPAFIIGKVMRLAVVDAKDLSEADFKDLEHEFKERQSSPRMWYVAWLQLESLNATTRATNWNFDIQKRDGSTVSAAATSKQWGRPKSWPDIPYTTLDLVEHGTLMAGQVCNILVYLVIDELASNLALETVRAHFIDGNGRPTVLMMDEARNAKRIFDEVQQTTSFRNRVPLFAQAIRKALIAYHGRTDVAEMVDNDVHAECTKRIEPLADGLEAALGRTPLIDSIRGGGFSTVRGMAKVADDLDIAAGLLR
ncbi:MAG: hypothetical protein ACYDHD_00325 [Vulcanimicrobiaceae bacterium]